MQNCSAACRSCRYEQTISQLRTSIRVAQEDIDAARREQQVRGWGGAGQAAVGCGGAGLGVQGFVAGSRNSLCTGQPAQESRAPVPLREVGPRL